MQKQFQKVLALALSPVLSLHDKFYGALNKTLEGVLDAVGDNVPSWFTADFVTWARSTLLVPTLLLIAFGQGLLPGVLILLVDFGDFLDGVVWRWWAKRSAANLPSGGAPVLPPSVASLSDSDLSYDVAYESYVAARRSSQWGQYFDAVADKAYLVPVWIALATRGENASSFIAFSILLALAAIEAFSAAIRTKRYVSDPGLAAPVPVAGADNDSGVRSDHLGKCKQTLQMLGSAGACAGNGYLAYLGTWYVGIALLLLAIPLAVESVRRKLVARSLLLPLQVQSGSLDTQALKIISAASSLGSRLTVGVIAHDPIAIKEGMDLLALHPNVDAVVPLLHSDIELSDSFMDSFGFDVLVVPDADSGVVTVGSDDYTPEIAASPRFHTLSLE